MKTFNDLFELTRELKLYGLLAHWDEVKQADWLAPLLKWENDERISRSLQRRLTSARLGRFKLLAQFDWSWPSLCDRDAIEEWMKLNFLETANNLILCGPNGVGKSTIAKNIAYQTVLQGHTALFISAAEMLNDLAAIDSDAILNRRLKRYTQPALLVIDEVGYLSYGNRHADLLFEIIARRYEQKSTFITTNKAFSEWNELFPNAACVVSLIDRLIHHSEIVNIEASSYRLKEAEEKQAERKLKRKKKITAPSAGGVTSEK